MGDHGAQLQTGYRAQEKDSASRSLLLPDDDQAVKAHRTEVETPSARRAGGRPRPVGLGQAIMGLIADRAWETPAAGGSVLDQWTAIAGVLARHVEAVRFDGETGCLDLQPEFPAYATHLMFEADRLINRTNEAVRVGTVKTIRILRPGPVTRVPTQADAAPGGQGLSAPSARSEPRREPPAGYLEAVKAARAHRGLLQASSELAAIAGRQSRDARRRGRVSAPKADDIVPMSQEGAAEQSRQCAL
ncbi:DciA family protein [Streptomyces sp. NPDC001478]